MIRLITLAAAALAGLTLAGCTTSAEPPIVRPGAEFGVEPLEPVLAWRENAAGDIVIRVQSSGCTTRDSFEIDVTGSAAAQWTFNVALTRIHADRCRAFLPEGVALIWTKDELGIPPSAEIDVLNPVPADRPRRILRVQS